MEVSDFMSEKFEVVPNFQRHTSDIIVKDTYPIIIYNDLGDISSVKPLCDLLNELYTENEYILNIIQKRLGDLEETYQIGAKKGLPTGGIIGEIDLLEEILGMIKANRHPLIKELNMRKK